MPEYVVDVWISAAPEGRKGWVQADSIEQAQEAFDDKVDECGDVFGATQDTGTYGDTDWEITEIRNDETGEVWRPQRVAEGFFLAELSTRNFDFTAFGRTEDEALLALKEGWRTHTERLHGSASDLFTWEELEEDVNVHSLLPGQCLRDGEPLSQNPF